MPFRPFALLLLTMLLAVPEATAQDGDPRRGRVQFLQCAACHALTPERAGKLGPSLYGVFGRRAGTAEDAVYSDAMLAADFFWNDETLDAYIAAPAQWLPGTSMIFRGIDDAARRADLIAYLRQATER